VKPILTLRNETAIVMPELLQDLDCEFVLDLELFGRAHTCLPNVSPLRLCDSIFLFIALNDSTLCPKIVNLECVTWVTMALSMVTRPEPLWQRIRRRCVTCVTIVLI
jgi:hypothetical protein